MGPRRGPRTSPSAHSPSSHFRAEPGLRLPRRTQHAPRPQGSTVAHDSILSLLREYDPARPGPPSCRPCIAHAPLKKPVHNPPEPEQELPVNNAVGCLLFCCYPPAYTRNTKYFLPTLLRSSHSVPRILTRLRFGPPMPQAQVHFTCTVAIQLPLDPCYPVRPTKCARLLLRERAKPSQYCCQLPPKSTIHPVPSHPRSSTRCSFLTSSSPPARARDRRRLPRASPCLVSPLRQTRSDRADRLDDSTTAGNF